MLVLYSRWKGIRLELDVTKAKIEANNKKEKDF